MKRGVSVICVRSMKERVRAKDTDLFMLWLKFKGIFGSVRYKIKGKSMTDSIKREGSLFQIFYLCCS